MTRRLALIAVILFPVFAVVLDAYPVGPEAFWLVFIAPLYLSAVGIYLMTGNPPRPVLRQRLLVALFSALILPSVLFTHWPLRLTFALAKPHLSAAVPLLREPHFGRNDLEVHGVNARFGPVTVRRIVRGRTENGSHPGYIGFWLDPKPGPNSDSGFRGFVYSDADRYPGNLGTDIDLGDGWRFVIED
jgi:hypothetical protein